MCFSIYMEYLWQHRLDYKSYYHRFIAINFAKLYWRTYTSMIPFIPNPADKSGDSHCDNHHFKRMIARKDYTALQHTRFILPPFHPRQNPSPVLRGRYFSFPQIISYVVVQSSKICFCCWPHNLKVLFLCLKEAGRSVRTAPSFLHTEPWILHKPSERDTVPWPHTFCERAGQRRCTNRGRNFVRGKRWPTTWAESLYLFFAS